jgi:hypothetical protein
MKIKLNELRQLIKSVIKEQTGVLSNEYQKSEEVFNKIKKMTFNTKPTKIYLDPEGDFISLNWNRPSEPGNNILAVTYRKGESTFDINLVDNKSNIEKCKKIKQAIEHLKGLGGTGSYRETSNGSCGGILDFNISEVDKISNMVNKIYKEIV